MVKRTFKYVDYNGNERTEDCYFNLNKAECIELELSTNGGIEHAIRTMIEALDGRSLMAAFKNIILKAYGVKSADGRRFIKSKELSEEFAQTEMYNQLMCDIFLNTNDSADIAKFLEEIIQDKPIASNGVVIEMPEAFKKNV